jgi:hypothetical protein
MLSSSMRFAALFNSGTVPGASEQGEAIQAIGRRLDADGGRTDTSIDALAEWRTTRQWVQWIAGLRRHATETLTAGISGSSNRTTARAICFAPRA